LEPRIQAGITAKVWDCRPPGSGGARYWNVAVESNLRGEGESGWAIADGIGTPESYYAERVYFAVRSIDKLQRYASSSVSMHRLSVIAYRLSPSLNLCQTLSQLD
jgi:hypothetical protein